MTSGDLFADEQSQAKKTLAGPVTCLGMTFENDEARRAYFTEELRKKLQDPEFRKIEGFPLGDDEDILNLRSIKDGHESLLSQSNASFEVILTSMISRVKISLETIGVEPVDVGIDTMKAMFIFL